MSRPCARVWRRTLDFNCRKLPNWTRRWSASAGRFYNRTNGLSSRKAPGVEFAPTCGARLSCRVGTRANACRLAKHHDLGLFASLQIIGNNIQWDWTIFRGHRVPYLANRPLPIDKIDDLVGIQRPAVLHLEQTVRSAVQQLDLSHALAPQTIQKHVIVLEGKRSKLAC